MNVIDNILLEWSYRCPDGIVDMNNPEKVKILFEILKPMLKEDIDDDILNLLSNKDISTKEKILTYLQKLDKGEEEKEDKETEKFKQSKQEKQLTIQKLKEKNIPEQVSRFIVFEASENEELGDLNELIDSLEELKKEGNLNDNGKIKNLIWINDIVSGQSSLGIGKGEILLSIMLKNGKLSEQTYGDIEFKGENIEVKQSSKSSKGILQGAIISDLGRSNDYRIIWNNKILNGQSFREKYDFEKLLSTWTPIFNKYKEVSNKEEYIEDLKTVMEAGDFTNLNEITKKDFEGSNKDFYKKIAYCSVGDYLSIKSLVLMNSNLDYVYLNEEEYKDTIINNPRVFANNSFSPRISYKEEIKNEEEAEKTSNKPKISQEIQKLISNIDFKKGLGNKIVVKAAQVDNEIAKKLINKNFFEKSTINVGGKENYYVVSSKYTDKVTIKEIEAE